MVGGLVELFGTRSVAGDSDLPAYVLYRGLQGPPTCSLLTFLCNMYCIGIILQIGSIMSMEYL